VKVLGFIPDVYRYSGAADVIVCRAGATNLAEFALQGKACIVVPGTFLAGGHQLQNARYLSDKDAALVLGEDELAEDPNRLAKKLAALLDDHDRINSLADRLAEFGRPDAADVIAKLILGQPDAKSTP
jgi:UDP-N-acetylglucosamine--N-acetylmuramyl-(pentapeptide) pyrophosphoryl-undecaprenol N-acetylglucosamine transferase